MRKLTLGILSVFLIAACAFGGTEAGMKEVQLQGSLARSSNDANDDVDYRITGQLVLNYFLGENFSIGAAIAMSGSVSDPEDPNEDEMVTISTFFLGRADLYLAGGDSSVIPYVGAQGGAVNFSYKRGDTDDSSTTIAYGGHAGFKVFPNETTSWNLEGNVTMYEPDVEEGDAITLTDMSLLLGFSYYF